MNGHAKGKNPLQTIDPRDLGARLRKSREARGWTQQRVADEIGMARTTVVAIEKGQRRLKPAELVRFAEIYAKKVSDFLQGTAPSEGFAVQLRSALRPQAAADSELLVAIEEFEQLCEDYRHLEALCHAPLRRRVPPLYEIQGADPEIAAADTAAAERRRLGLGNGPFLNLRDVLESDVGLRIFQLDLPSAVAGMFAYSSDLGGCIAVNLNHPIERRRVSLAREFGHFLVGRSRPEVLYLDRYERRPVEERFAEAFARSFLMPADGLRQRYFNLLRERDGAPTHGDLCRLAHFYAASVEAMTRRLEELKLIPPGVWERLRLEGFRVEEAQHLLGLESITAEDEMLPHRFMALAVEAWQRRKLSEGQLAHWLRVDRLQAREAVDRFGRSPKSASSAPIDLGAPLLNVV